jgi:hypothetical protein
VKNTDLILTALLIAFTGCGAQATAASPESAAATAAHSGAGTPPANPGILNGEIIETMNAAGYTYVLLDTGAGETWVAASETSVKVGQRVSVPAGQLMTGFSSKTLNRNFDRIVFASGIYPEGTLDKTAGQGPGMTGSSRTVVTDAHVQAVARAEGGYTVEEILARSSELNGQKVKVRGQVVKFSAGIMGTNWMHIQDGTPGDLPVTTDALVAKGDLVMVEGVLAVNKNFGAGYLYPVIIEKATVTPEQGQ